MGQRFLELKNITKSFGNVVALEDINLSINQGEVVALIGDNGAGKSTLIKIISGFHSPDKGDIIIKGNIVKNWSITKARAARIETVYQDRALALQQTISRNIFMGRERTGPLGFIKKKQQYVEADFLMRKIGFTSKAFSSSSVVAELSGGERQGVAIARALYFDADLIILDEPTTALSLKESKKVFDFIKKAKEAGTSCIYITHNIFHVYDVGERFIILDKGRIKMVIDKKNTTVEKLLFNFKNIIYNEAL